MALRVWGCLLLVMVASHQSLAQIGEDEEARVVEILGEVTQLIRQKYNITRPAMEPSQDMIKTSLLENDLRLTEEQAGRLLETLQTEMGVTPTRRRSSISRRIYPYASAKWSSPIAYAFDGTHSDSEKAIIRQGLDRWRVATCMNFKEYSSPSSVGSQPSITITKGSGCWSYVGKTGSGAQMLSLGDGCVHPGITAHEFGHAMGLWHEHMRPDRDDYLTINWNNIISGYEGAFTKLAATDDIDYGTGYDVTSIMHYDSLGFSVDYWGKKRVMVPSNIYQLTAIGNREYVSFNDAKRVNMHYGCIAKNCAGISLAQACQNNGYQDPNNCAKCRCPPATGGDFCQDVAAAVGVSCGGTINVPRCSSVSLTSPSYPKTYSASTSCAWKIQSTGGLVFAFEQQPDLPAKPSDSCLDYVDIFTDTTKLNRPGNRYCSGGKSSGRVGVDDDGQAYVVFGTTGSAWGGGGHSGFKLTIYSTCTGTTAAGLTQGCTITSTGYDYQGTQSSSTSGSCSAWSGQSTLTDLSFPDATLLAAGSSCRNPDSRSSPWCYNSRTYTTVGYCSIAKCPTGTDTTSSTTTTTTTTTTKPTTTTTTTTTTKPTTTTTTTVPTTTTTTTKPTTTTTTTVPTTTTTTTKATTTTTTTKPSTTTTTTAPKTTTTTTKATTTTTKGSNGGGSTTCLKTQAGREYIGTQAYTKSGIPCQRWDSQWPQRHSYTSGSLFPDGSVSGASNYCRNPESAYTAGVWCLTQNPFIRWEACAVPMCSAKRDSKIDLEELINRMDFGNEMYDSYDK